jgi:hypothetical protein
LTHNAAIETSIKISADGVNTARFVFPLFWGNGDSDFYVGFDGHANVDWDHEHENENEEGMMGNKRSRRRRRTDEWSAKEKWYFEGMSGDKMLGFTWRARSHANSHFDTQPMKQHLFARYEGRVSSPHPPLHPVPTASSAHSSPLSSSSSSSSLPPLDVSRRAIVVDPEVERQLFAHQPFWIRMLTTNADACRQIEPDHVSYELNEHIELSYFFTYLKDTIHRFGLTLSNLEAFLAWWRELPVDDLFVPWLSLSPRAVTLYVRFQPAEEALRRHFQQLSVEEFSRRGVPIRSCVHPT